MMSKDKGGSCYVEPKTYPNKPKGGSAKAMYAGKHERAMGHVQPGMSMAASLAKKNRGSK